MLHLMQASYSPTYLAPAAAKGRVSGNFADLDWDPGHLARFPGHSCEKLQALALSLLALQALRAKATAHVACHRPSAFLMAVVTQPRRPGAKA